MSSLRFVPLSLLLAATSLAAAASSCGGTTTDGVIGSGGGTTTGSPSATTSTNSTTSGHATGSGGGAGKGGQGGTGGGAGTGGSSVGGAGSLGKECAELCATEATLNCSTPVGPTCPTACVQIVGDVPWCQADAQAWMACAGPQPASALECNASGNAALKATTCPTETDTLKKCWYDGPPGGLPDLTAQCTALCAAESGLPCASGSCAALCQAVVAPGSKCNGAYAGWIQCASTMPAADFACSAAMPPEPKLATGVCGFQALMLFDCLNGV